MPERDPGMRVERDHRGREARLDHRVDHRDVASMDSVEGSDRDRPRLPNDLRRCMRDPHSSLARASSGGMIRSSSASSTRNGPISVLRSVGAVSPRASAIARTVRPRGDVEIETDDAVGVALLRQLVHDHATDRHLDRNALPMELVRPFAVDLHRGRRGDRQLDRPAEAVERERELVGRGWIVLFDHVALGIAGRRRRRQVDLRQIPLREADELG